MNCKPGDLAVIVKGKYSGRLVDVLYLAPFGQHTLPNGKGAWTDVSDGWVVRARDRFLTVSTVSHGAKEPSGTRRTKYVVAQDHGLRPIRDPGEDAVDETLLWVTADKRAAQGVSA